MMFVAKILIAEDSATQAEQLRILLDQQGYQVSVAKNGKLALDMISEFNPDLVISDINMPEMNGYELCQQIKTENCTLNIPVVLLTSLSNPEDVLEGLSCGADSFITKPYNKEYLIAHIQQMLANWKLRKNDYAQVSLDLLFGGKRRLISADPQQMLGLLLSTYEAAVQRNNDLIKTQEELSLLNEKLEVRVAERTAALSAEIVERKHIEAVLLESEQRFRGTFDQAAVGIAQLGIDGNWLRVNQKFCSIIGYTQDDLLGLPIQKITHPDDLDSEETSMQQILAGDIDTFNIEKRFICKDQSVVWISQTVSLVREASNKPKYFISVMVDINQMKEAEFDLRKTLDALAQSNAKLERFAYVTSHDLQEPLRLISSFLQLLEKRYKDKLDNDALDFINYAVQGSKYMKALIIDLLAYSQVETAGSEFEKTDFENVFINVVSNFKNEIENGNVKITHDPLPGVIADSDQMEILLNNLIGNALKFKGNKSPKIHVGVEQKNNDWVFSVNDNGIGIDPQYSERIFIIFQRLQNREEYSGTGIGLAISKLIVERHGGVIWVESQPGQGSTFFFTLPKAGVFNRNM